MSTEQKITRKLRAIFSADVKGYSTLMTNDEVSTIQTLKEYRSIMSGIINDHSGNVVDMPGDNIMAEFSSVVNAVQSSVAIQKALQLKNRDLPHDKRLEFRIGINIGDVVQDGDSLYGEGVNIAARIEGLADPGGICISRGAYDHIRNKLKFGYEYIGEHTVKNIKNPVRAYKILIAQKDAGKLIGEEPKPLLKSLAWSAIILASIMLIAYLFFQKPVAPEFEPASIEKMAFELPEKPSIAVLPFYNMSGDPEQDYFSDGISENIITTLLKISQLFVIARNSSFTYKGKAVKVKQIAEDLGVQYVLEGSVQKIEDRVRATAKLIDAFEGNHLWAERYDRDFKDIFALQDELTMKIVTALQIKLTEGEQARIFAKQIKNTDIFDKALQTISLLNEGSAESFIRFGQLAQEIVDEEPESSFGYIYLGVYHYVLARRGRSRPENVKKAFKLAQKAHSIDESDGLSHVLFCNVYLLMKEYEKAIASGKRAVELQPNIAPAHRALGSTLGNAGRFDEAIVHLEQAIRLNPFPAYYYYYPLGLCYMFKGRLEDALIEFKKHVQLVPNYPIAHWILAINYIYLGRNEEARASAVKALELDPNLSVSLIRKISNYKNPEYTQYLIDAMRKAGFPE